MKHTEFKLPGIKILNKEKVIQTSHRCSQYVEIQDLKFKVTNEMICPKQNK